MLEEGGIKEGPFILEIVPPALEKHETYYNYNELEKIKDDDGKYLVFAKEPSLKFIMKNDALDNYSTFYI